MKQNEIVVLRKHGLNKCTSRQLLSQEFMKEIKTILNNLKDKLLILQWRMYSNSRLTVESTNKGIKWKCRDIIRSTITLVTRMIMMSSWPNPTTTPLIDWTQRKALYYSPIFTSWPCHFRSASEWSLNADPEPECDLWPGLDLAPALLSSPTVTRAKPPKRRPPSNHFKFPVSVGKL